MFKHSKLVFLIFFSFSTFANDNFHFELLNERISIYSSKLSQCSALKKKVAITPTELSTLKSIIEKNPVVLSYLSVRSSNSCLQPERGQLAEVLLAYEMLELPHYVTKLANTAKKMTFSMDFEGYQQYLSLSVEDREFIDSIQELHNPFDELELLENIFSI